MGCHRDTSETGYTQGVWYETSECAMALASKQRPRSNNFGWKVSTYSRQPLCGPDRILTCYMHPIGTWINNTSTTTLRDGPPSVDRVLQASQKRETDWKKGNYIYEDSVGCSIFCRCGPISCPVSRPDHNTAHTLAISKELENVSLPVPLYTYSTVDFPNKLVSLASQLIWSC